MNRFSKAISLGLLAPLVFACSDDSEAGKGNVAFSTWGEEFIEKEIPPTVDGQVVVVDGWTIRYNKFLVVIRNIRVADGGGVAAEMTTSKIFDMKKPGEKAIVQFNDLPAKIYEHVSYEISPAAADTQVDASATAADKDLMVAGGYAVYVDAEASKGAVTKKYTWGFKEKTIYDRCKGMKDGKDLEGVNVTNGSTDKPQLTIHGDHLYYDDLQATDALVRFDNIAAADANNDGTITLQELSAVNLANIDKEKGHYGVGGRSDVYDLGAFVTALSTTVGHFRGEGECFVPGTK